MSSVIFLSFVEAGVDVCVEKEYPEGCKWDYGEIYLITTYCIWKFHEASENDARTHKKTSLNWSRTYTVD